MSVFYYYLPANYCPKRRPKLRCTELLRPISQTSCTRLLQRRRLQSTNSYRAGASVLPISTGFYRAVVAVLPEKTEQIDNEETQFYQFLPGGFRNSTNRRFWNFYRVLPFSTGSRAISLPMLAYTTCWAVYVVYVLYVVYVVDVAYVVYVVEGYYNGVPMSNPTVTMLHEIYMFYQFLRICSICTVCSIYV